MVATRTRPMAVCATRPCRLGLPSSTPRRPFLQARGNKRDEAGSRGDPPPACDLCGGAPDRSRRVRCYCGPVARAFLTRRPTVRRPVVGGRAIAAGIQILAWHGHARPRSPFAPPLRRAHLACHWTGRKRHSGDDRNDRRGRRGLHERVCRECADALHRSDDGLPSAPACDRSSGAVETQPVDRRARDRARQLGAGGADHLHRDTRARGAGLHSGRTLAWRRAYAHSFSPHRAASPAERNRVGNARRCNDGVARSDALLPRRRRAAAAALLGQHHLREPELLPGRPVARFHPRRDHSRDGAFLQSYRRRLTRPASPHPTGTRLRAALLARRVIQAVAVLLGVAVITFVLLHYLPANPAALVAGRSANAQMIANVRHQLGLDLPLPLQFWRYLTGLVRGDLGRSYIQRSEVTTLVVARIPATLILMACGILVEVALGLTLGVIAAVRRNGVVDRTVMMFAFVGVSSPQFVVALLLLYVFAAHLGWFPMSGFGTPAHVVLPALTLGLLGAGWYARMVRSAMIDVLNQDYVRTARAKGLSGSRVVLRHALPNALLPIIAMIGIDIGQFMGGVVVVEAVYGWA